MHAWPATIDRRSKLDPLRTRRTILAFEACVESQTFGLESTSFGTPHSDQTCYFAFRCLSPEPHQLMMLPSYMDVMSVLHAANLAAHSCRHTYPVHVSLRLSSRAATGPASCLLACATPFVLLRMVWAALLHLATLCAHGWAHARMVLLCLPVPCTQCSLLWFPLHHLRTCQCFSWLSTLQSMNIDKRK